MKDDLGFKVHELKGSDRLIRLPAQGLITDDKGTGWGRSIYLTSLCIQLHPTTFELPYSAIDVSDLGR